jgi:TonB-linked SusC/RagA family outer membrane protein
MKICTIRKTNKHCDFIKKRVLLIFFLCLAASTNFSNAQELVIANQELSVTEKRISVHFDEISLDEALIKIGQKTGLNVNYNANLFDSSHKLTFQAKGITLFSLLEEILPANTGFRVYENSIILHEKVNKGSDLESIQLTVTGQIVDKVTGDPLPGVNIIIKGTDTGTTTDADGMFELTVSDLDQTLIVSYIGYERTEIYLNGREELMIELNPTIISGDELVVVGYGVTSKEDLTGSVSSIDGEDLTNIAAPRVDQVLQGRASGVQVTQSSGAPGTSSTIRIRGGNSIQGNNDPLFVIDNFIVGTDFNLNNLNTNDIESIEVLKDATAVAVYGTRGSNGVILITTKNGEGVTSDGPEITLNSYTGMQYLMNTVDFLTGPQHAAYANEDAEYRNASLPFSNPRDVPNVNWIDQISRDAPISNFDLSVSGQSENRDLNYYVSGNYFNQQGIIRGSAIDRYNLRTNFDLDLSSVVKTGLRLNISRLFNENNKTNFPFILSTAGLTNRDIYQADGTFTAENPVSASLQRNAEADILLRSDHTTVSNVLGNLYVEIEPLSGLILRSNFGSKIRYTKGNVYNPGQLPGNLAINDGGDGTVSVSTNLDILNENTVSYITEFGNEHNIDFLAGFTWQKNETENVGATGFNFPNDALTYNNLSNGSDPERNQIGSGWDSFQLVSWLARTNYSFRDKYLFTMVGRVDGSSRFAGSNNEYGFFPSAAVAWQLGDEPFIKQMNIFDQLKLRASYGISGNQAINSFRTLPVLNGTSAFFNDSEVYAVQNGRPASNDLKWETTKQLDLGLEAAFFNYRLTFEADYYQKTTEDLLLNVQIPRQTGFNSKLQNLGEIQNKGLEFSINSVNVATNSFQWSSTVSISGNRNKVLDLGGVEFIDIVSPTQGGPGGRLIVGESAPVFVGVEYLGTWKSQAEIDASGQQGQQVGGPRFKDTNGDGDVSSEDFEVIGSPQPDFFGGIQNTFQYKNWQLDLFIEGTYGNEIYNSLTQTAFFGRSETNKYAETLNRWTPENTNSDVPRAGTVQTLASVYSNSKMVEDASYLRLKHLKLTYDLPMEKIGLGNINDLSVYFSGSNLLLLSNFRLFDPEVNQYSGSNVATGFTEGEYPYGRTLTLGIKATL